jgi:hypothetical protein
VILAKAMAGSAILLGIIAKAPDAVASFAGVSTGGLGHGVGTFVTAAGYDSWRAVQGGLARRSAMLSNKVKRFREGTAGKDNSDASLQRVLTTSATSEAGRRRFVKRGCNELWSVLFSSKSSLLVFSVRHPLNRGIGYL